MSAEQSLISTNTFNTITPTESYKQSALSQPEQAHANKKNELSPLIDDEFAILLTKDEISPKNIDTNLATSEKTTENTPSTEQQLTEIATLQKKLLNDANFDINDLEATSAGIQDNYIAAINEKSTGSPLYIETNIETDAINIINENNASPLTDNPTPLDTHINADRIETGPIVNQQSLGQNKTQTIQTQINEDLITTREGKFDNTSLDAGTMDSELGTLSYQEDGSWTYTLDNQSETIQSLGANQNLSDHFTVTSKSGETIELIIGIHGTNDTALISGDTSAEVNTLSNFESGTRPETIHGKLNISDKDTGEANFNENNEISTTYGQASITESGEWSYALDSQLESIKNLKKGETLTDTITAQSQDGTSQHIKITIFGANDKPILSGQNSESINLNEQTQIHEKLNINDPDFGESSFIAKSDIESENGYGTGAIDANGNWSFTVATDHPKVSTLDNDDQLLDFFMVTTADGTEQSIIIKIQNNTLDTNNTSQSLANNDTGTQITLVEDSDEQSALNLLNAQTSSNQSHSSAIDTSTNADTAPISASHLDNTLLENHLLNSNNNSLDII